MSDFQFEIGDEVFFQRDVRAVRREVQFNKELNNNGTYGRYLTGQVGWKVVARITTETEFGVSRAYQLSGGISSTVDDRGIRARSHVVATEIELCAENEMFHAMMRLAETFKGSNEDLKNQLREARALAEEIEMLTAEMREAQASS